MKKKIIGIIAEFNPLHKGHKYLIETAKKENPESSIIVVMSGEFVQRGDLSIYNKWYRAEIAIDSGVDLVIEIPSFYVLNNANVFSDKAIEILSDFNVTDIYFGTENLDLFNIKKISYKIINNKKEMENLKIKYHSLPKAMEHFIGMKIKPNDTLAICYIMSNEELKLNIKFHRVQRDRYKFKSASEIRLELSVNNKFEYYRTIEEYKYFIFGKLMTTDTTINSVKHMKNILIKKGSQNLFDLINDSSSSNFTKSRLRRDLIKFILNLVDEDKRIILAFNKSGRKILKKSSAYEFRHTKDNLNNLKIESFLSLVNNDFLNNISMSSIIKK